MELSDDQFLSAFESGSLPAFHHIDHLRMTFLYLQRLGIANAPRMIVEGIRSFARTKGAVELYNETMTRFWILVVAEAAVREGANSFDDLVARHPELLDKSLALKHWTPAVLNGEAAKRHWVEPDAIALPFAAEPTR
ncbi:MAG: hypothetical protein LC750_12085 [Actinobacteria bacterium]|nr:hypothetical protein [Actinomycetota bacterium]